ncbi:hypothetical protein LTS18_008631, partial [Coniosporium uncinatum]
SPGYLEGAGYAAGWLYPVDDETEEAVPSPVSFEEGKAHGNETQKHSNEMHGAEEKGRPGAVSTQKNSNTSSSIPFAGLKHDLSRIGSVDKGEGKEAIHEAIDWTCGSEVNGGVSQHQNNGAVQRGMDELKATLMKTQERMVAIEQSMSRAALSSYSDGGEGGGWMPRGANAHNW